MREIKFRAWNGSKMLYPQFPKDGYINVPLEFSEDSSLVQEPQQSIYMQYTGLKDKNGKEIYGGDIVKSDAQEKPQEVKWVDMMAGFEPFVDQIPVAADSYSEWTITEIEVIGNVYENKELLK